MTMPSQYQTDMLQDRFARRITARLSDACDDMPHDISERLRFARMQALAKRKTGADTAVAVATGGGAAILGGLEEKVSWWNRLGAVLPLIALVVGLIISIFQAATQLNESTLQFVPKLVAMFVVLLLAGPWMLQYLIDYIQRLFGSIPQLIG